MKRSDLSELQSRISDIVERSSLRKRARGVSVEAEESIEGGDFLRVIVKLKGSEKLRYRQVAPLLKSIEQSVAEVDERFPSVRFREAA
jgi:hypothetical protein